MDPTGGLRRLRRWEEQGTASCHRRTPPGPLAALQAWGSPAFLSSFSMQLLGRHLWGPHLPVERFGSNPPSGTGL